MTSAIADASDTFLVLINEEGQYSLWQPRAKVPNGWSIVFGPSDQQSCLNHVEQNWTDMRPKSLRRTMSDSR